MRGCAIGLPSLELGECVQHVRVAGSVAAELLQHRARIRGTSRKRIDSGQREPHLGTRGVQLSRPA